MGRKNFRGLAPLLQLLVILGWLWCSTGALASGPAGAPGSGGLQVVMALDTSGSMKVNDPLRLMPKAAWVLANLLTERDSLSLMRFDDAPQSLVPPGPLDERRRRQCREALFSLSPRGRYTNLWAVLAEGLKAFDLNRPESRALVLLTDGHMDIDPRK